MITTNIAAPIKVQFIKEIFEDDFVETGMIAMLMKVEWSTKYNDCYELFFDFSDFEEHNDKLFTKSYWPNCHTKHIEQETGRTMFTAKEAQCYDPKYSVFFSCIHWMNRDDEAFAKEIQDYLIEL